MPVYFTEESMMLNRGRWWGRMDQLFARMRAALRDVLGAGRALPPKRRPRVRLGVLDLESRLVPAPVAYDWGFSVHMGNTSNAFDLMDHGSGGTGGSIMSNPSHGIVSWVSGNSYTYTS